MHFLWKRIRKLCANQYQRNPRKDSNMKCIHLDHKNPYLKLGPFKFEKLHQFPLVGYLHDFINDNETDQMKNDARKTLKSTPYRVGKSYLAFSRWRTSKITYINENMNSNAMKISKKIELATQTSLSKGKYDSENFQVHFL